MRFLLFMLLLNATGKSQSVTYLQKRGGILAAQHWDLTWWDLSTGVLHVIIRERWCPRLSHDALNPINGRLWRIGSPSFWEAMFLEQLQDFPGFHIADMSRIITLCFLPADLEQTPGGENICRQLKCLWTRVMLAKHLRPYIFTLYLKRPPHAALDGCI